MNVLTLKAPRSGAVRLNAPEIAALKLRVRPGFAGSVSGESPITVENTGGNFVVGISVEDVTAILETAFDTFIAQYFEDLASSRQIVTGASATITAGLSWVFVNRTAPTTTALTLPSAATRDGLPLRIADYSESVTDHIITLTPAVAAQTIMRQSTWELRSNPSNLASVTLWPVEDPDDASNHVWIIAP